MKSYLIYAREECPFCKKLLNFMKERNEKFVYVLVYNLEEKLQLIMSKYNWNTVPIVLEMEGDNGKAKLIGGCTDAIEFFERKSLGGNTISIGGDN